MKYDVKTCEILSKNGLTKDVCDVTVNAGEMAEQSRPGQFVHIYVPGKTLRRPISICGIDRERGILRLVFQIRGEGTEQLSKMEQGDAYDLLGPLGNGFSLGSEAGHTVFVGGGIGVPPLLEAAKECAGNVTAVLGFRDKNAVILEEDFKKICGVQIATDDGSYGHHGLVTELLAPLNAGAIYACGPTPMLKAVVKFAQEKNIPCQVSLEERMACGIGACLGCACKLRRDGKEFYGHVCKDGPVFDSREVVWEG